MTIMLTGGGGFVGLNIAEALLRAGQDVFVLDDRPPPAHAIATLEALPGKLYLVTADVSNRGAVDAAFRQSRPDRVIHAAAITCGRERELRDTGRVIDVNIKGTANVLRAACESGVERFIHVSSGSVYGEALLGAGPLTESASAPVPDTLYAITKFAAERLCMRMRETNGLNVVCVRLGSVFGPWEFDTGVRDTLSLPLRILRIAMREGEVLFARNEPRRDWIYSRDVAAGIASILQAPTVPDALYNLASGFQWANVSAEWCACLRAEFPRFWYRPVAGRETPNVEFLGNLDRALMSNERLREDTGFQPTFDQHNAFADYLAWISEHAANFYPG